MNQQQIREQELTEYAREMFWHEPKKQVLIKNLLKRIYKLEDNVNKLQHENRNL